MDRFEELAIAVRHSPTKRDATFGPPVGRRESPGPPHSTDSLSSTLIRYEEGGANIGLR